MRYQSRMTIRSTRGITLPELIVVAALMGIIAAIALPSYIQWWRSADYRSTARHIASILRQAQNNAISTNLEQQVVINAGMRQYGIQIGTASYNAVFPAPIYTGPLTNVTNVTNLPSDVASFATTTTINFVPNGTAPTGAVDIVINDSTNTKRFNVHCDPTGRISVTGPF